ncbi:hypothetical protein [Flexithrix dorotheae]|uniref:hypothetical protein n=1 Tax=Flexithrix dorotheae TaxID=70993 RepID=UPI000378B6A0|nr:hypothetical protein [Flexithrix dorotheae]
MTRYFKNVMVIAAGLLVFSCSNVKKDGELSSADSVQTEEITDSVETMVDADSIALTDSMAMASDSIVVAEEDSTTLEE